MIGLKRTVAAVLVSVLLVATAVTSVWLLASAGVFTGAERPLPAAPEVGPGSTAPAAVGGNASSAAGAGFQVAQPRDPFEPLVGGGGGGGGDTTTTSGTGSTTTTGGETTSTTAGGGSTTTSGDTTTTSVSDSPNTLRVDLLEVRDEAGSLVAVVEVDGQTHTVGVGDTFATNFKVISLTLTGGVFTYGDSAFTLSVGQTIFK